MKYFGDPFYKPGALETVPAPTGQFCLYCAAEILPDDSGFLIPYIQTDKMTEEPWHQACLIKSILP